MIVALLASGDQGVRVNDIAHSPDMPSGKVSKALIALLAANHVIRVSNNVCIRDEDPLTLIAGRRIPIEYATVSYAAIELQCVFLVWLTSPGNASSFPLP